MSENVSKGDVADLVNCCLSFVDEVKGAITNLKGNPVESRYFLSLICTLGIFAIGMLGVNI